MLRIATIPHLMRIAAKIDLKPVIEQLKEVDIFDDKKPATKQLSKEKLGVLGMEALTAVTPQLGKIADDLVPLIAAYKNVSLEEAEGLDALEVISEIAHDKAIRNFFKSALRKKAAPSA